MLLKLLFSLLFLTTHEENEKLVYVMTTFRHGARQQSLKGKKRVDQFGEKWDFPKELTGVGKREHYLLGLRNRIRYIDEKNFLSKKFNVKELDVYTSLSNRTIMSVISQLQGLYPQSLKLGDVLNDIQINNSNPPFNLNYSLINEEKNLLKNYALPDCMTVIPFQTINEDKGANIYKVSECGIPDDGKSNGTNESFLLTKEFNEKYSKYFNEYNEKDSSYEYTFDEISDICSPYIRTYTDVRNMTSLKETGIDLYEFYIYSLEAIRISKRDSYLAVKDTLFLQGSKLMELFINNMKMKIDMDINNVPEEDSYYTPKMLIISGHDHTLCIQELFIILAFDFDINTFRLPTFSSQTTFEVTTNNNSKINKDYSDYFISYYFNEDRIFNITVEEFLQKIEPNMWSSEEIDSLCDENTKSSDKTNNENTNNDTNINDDININNNNSNVRYNNIYFSSKKENKGVKTALIIITSLFGASIIANIVLTSLLLRKNNDNNLQHQITSSQLHNTM